MFVLEYIAVYHEYLQEFEVLLVVYSFFNRRVMTVYKAVLNFLYTYSILYAYAENKIVSLECITLGTVYFTKLMDNYKIYIQVHKIIYFSENIYVGKDHYYRFCYKYLGYYVNTVN